MAKYILTSRVFGKEVMQAGDAIELTAEQAAHPFYRTRVRKADTAVTLEPATPKSAKKKDEEK